MATVFGRIVCIMQGEVKINTFIIFYCKQCIKAYKPSRGW